MGNPKENENKQRAYDFVSKSKNVYAIGYYEDEIDGMAWKSVKLVDANSNEVYSYHTDNITGIFAFCTSYCVKESSKNMYSSYSLI